MPIAVAVSGQQSIELFAPSADAMIAVQPDAELCQQWRRHAPDDERIIGQIPICFDADEHAAIQRAHEQFRWFGGGWKVNAELPGTGRLRRRHPVRPARGRGRVDSLRTGRQTDRRIGLGVLEAGFTDIALVQIGGEHQREFFDFAQADLLPALRAAAD